MTKRGVNITHGMERRNKTKAERTTFMDSFDAQRKPKTRLEDIAAVYGWLKDSITRSRLKGPVQSIGYPRETSAHDEPNACKKHRVH